MTGLTVDQTTDGIGRQLWLTEQLVDLLAPWDEPGDDPELRVWVAGARRRIQSHGEQWRHQLPESVLLEPEARIISGPDDEHLAAAARDAQASADWAEAVGQLLMMMIEQLDELVADAGPIADASLVRAAGGVRRDLDGLVRALPLS